MKRLSTHWHNMTPKSIRLFGVVLVALLLMGRVVLFVYVRTMNSQTAAQEFNSTTQQEVTALTSQFEVYANMLYSARALLLVNPNISGADWNNFVSAQNIVQRYPATAGVGYVTVINRTEATNLLARLNAHRDSILPVVIYPSSSDDQLAVLTYLAPATANQRAVGYDLYSDPQRQQALYMARDSGLVHASVPVVPIAGAGSSLNVVLALPTYASASVATVQERQAALTGYVVIGLHTQALLDPIFNATNSEAGVAAQVYTNHQLLYQTAAKPTLHALAKQVNVDVSGQTWQLDFTAPESFGLSTGATLFPLILTWSMPLYAALLLLGLYMLLKLKGD